MGTFDTTAPAQSHTALSDIDQIRNNLGALRSNESSVAGSPPSNPTTGQLWYTTDTKETKQYKSTSTWQTLWSETDPPSKASELTAHAALSTATSSVHGARQGHTYGFNADTLDTYHATSFTLVSDFNNHTGAISTHGVTGNIVGTGSTQTLTNKTFGSGCSINSNLTVADTITIDTRDISVDGAKLDTYPGGGLATPVDASTTQEKLAYAAGEALIISSDVNSTILTTATLTLMKEIRIARGGTIRIRFTMVHGWTSGTIQITGQIYRSRGGSPTAVGTLRTMVGTDPDTEYTEDISGWVPGDLVQIKCTAYNAQHSAMIKNFRLYNNHYMNEVITLA